MSEQKIIDKYLACLSEYNNLIAELDQWILKEVLGLPEETCTIGLAYGDFYDWSIEIYNKSGKDLTLEQVQKVLDAGALRFWVIYPDKEIYYDRDYLNGSTNKTRKRFPDEETTSLKSENRKITLFNTRLIEAIRSFSPMMDYLSEHREDLFDIITKKNEN